MPGRVVHDLLEERERERRRVEGMGRLQAPGSAAATGRGRAGCGASVSAAEAERVYLNVHSGAQAGSMTKSTTVTRPIHFSENAMQQAETRGVTLDEIVDAIRTEPWRVGRTGWFECRKNLACRSAWAGVAGDTKQVRPVFTVEPGRVVVLSVYSYRVRTKP
jgi:hypothetical protein